jgi:hypothetical protein
MLNRERKTRITGQRNDHKIAPIRVAFRMRCEFREFEQLTDRQSARMLPTLSPNRAPSASAKCLARTPVWKSPYMMKNFVTGWVVLVGSSLALDSFMGVDEWRPL